MRTYRHLLLLLMLLASCASRAPDRCDPGPLALPASVEAVEGTPVRVVLDDAADSPGLSITARSDAGSADARAWTLAPGPRDQGEHELSLEARDSSGALVGCASTSVRVRPAPAPGCASVRLLLVGDSLTEQTWYPNDLARMLDASGIAWTMLGTVAPTGCDPAACQDALPGVRHQGFGGWTWTMYLERFVAHPSGGRLVRSSPFLFDEGSGPVLDVGRYVSATLGGVEPDVAVFLLGSNDCFNVRSDDDSAIDACAQKAVAAAEKLLGAFRAALPRADLDVALIPPGNERDAPFKSTYGPSYSAAGWRRIQRRVVRAELAAFDRREADGIRVVPTELAVDPAADFSPTNAAHPNPGGYQAFAESVLPYVLARATTAPSVVGCSNPAQ
jgi:lysophospholipase L1-like esterase